MVDLGPPALGPEAVTVLSSKKKQLERVAYHEAGHAVVSWLFSQRFIEVDILPSEERFGQTRSDGTYLEM
jgi:ATP-dependent Zn protease